MRSTLALVLALLVLGSVGFFWLREAGSRGGNHAPAVEHPTAALAPSAALAPLSEPTEPAHAREVGGQGPAIAAEDPPTATPD